jgi:hypothetical protein
MLIVNDEQRLRAGIRSMDKRCQYCSKALAAYPLILSDDAKLAVYHASCAVQLATEIMVDLYTFFSPPAPYLQLYVLTAPQAAPTHETSLGGAGKVSASQDSPDKGVTHAVNGYLPDEGGSLGSSIYRECAGELLLSGRGKGSSRR